MLSGQWTDRFEVECAIWHPTAPASRISDIIGLTPRFQWSAGDINVSTGTTRDRTYCRFYLGKYSQEQINTGLVMLDRFKALSRDTIFCGPDTSIVVYFKNLDDAAELHINLRGISALKELNASIVFR